MSSLEFKTPEWMGPQEWVYERIRTETGRVGSRAYVLAKELADLHPSLRGELLLWWQTGTIEMDREVEGWSVRSLINSHLSNYVSEALTWLSHLRIDPAGTKAQLAKPICTIIGPWPEVPHREPVH